MFFVCAGLPVQLPRRASAYDVYAVRSGDPGVGGGLNPAALAAAVANVSRQLQQQGQQQSQQPSVRCVPMLCCFASFHLPSIQFPYLYHVFLRISSFIFRLSYGFSFLRTSFRSPFLCHLDFSSRLSYALSCFLSAFLPFLLPFS
jgi:hypothetical protein